MIETDKLIMIIIFIIVLVVCIYILLEFVKPNGDTINLQTKISQCCTIYRAYGDKGACPSPLMITCQDGSNLKSLADQAGMSPDDDFKQIKAFCGCSV